MASTLARTARALTYMRLMRLSDELRLVASELESLARTCCPPGEEPCSDAPVEP